MTAATRILVVDDNLVLRELLTDFITQLDHHVDATSDGNAALARLAQEPYDALLADIVLPDLDGWQLVASAIRIQPMLRVVLMTGADDQNDNERIAALRVPVLTKPFSLEALRKALHEALTASTTA